MCIRDRDIDRPGLEALSDQLERWGYHAAAYHQCDLSDREEIEDTARQVLALSLIHI